MRLVLRYYVAIVMLIYGAFKVIPSQFPPIALEQRVVFSRPGVMSTKVMTERMRSFGVSVDTTKRRIGDTLDMVLSRLDPGAAYRLLRQ